MVVICQGPNVLETKYIEKAWLSLPILVNRFGGTLLRGGGGGEYTQHFLQVHQTLNHCGDGGIG